MPSPPVVAAQTAIPATIAVLATRRPPIRLSEYGFIARPLEAPMISARSTRVTLVTWIEVERTTTSLWLAGWLVGDAGDKPGKSRAPTISRLEIRAMMMMGAQGLGRKGVSSGHLLLATCTLPIKEGNTWAYMSSCEPMYSNGSQVMSLLRYSVTNGAHGAAIVGGFTAKYAGWRWCYWVPAIILGGTWLITSSACPKRYQRSSVVGDQRRSRFQLFNFKTLDKPQQFVGAVLLYLKLFLVF